MLSFTSSRSHQQHHVQHSIFIQPDGAPAQEISDEDEQAFRSMMGEEDTFQSTPVQNTAVPEPSRALSAEEIALEEYAERRFGHQSLIAYNPEMSFKDMARHLLHSVSPHNLGNLARNLIANHLINRKIKKMRRKAHAEG